MRKLCTALLLWPLCLNAQSTLSSASVPSPGTEAEAGVASLLDVALGFDGQDSLAIIHRLLEAGATIDEKDTRGNTPLLLLCMPLEMDYRYSTDPHFARAVDEAITTLVQKGASVLHENDNGCNATFYLQSKPELLKSLTDAGLMPKELAVRIPHETAAFSRYMRKRTAQVALTKHEECRQYLIRQYCAPAYERAEARLTDIISTEDTRKQTSDIAELLGFMRLADTEKAHQYVHNLRYWEHGEHLLEEVPSRVLAALNELKWEVSSENLHKALKKLDSMLPGSPDEMIDCFAAQPMGVILEMLERREGEQAMPIIREYCNCNEADLASTAYSLLLRHNRLPAPTPAALLERYKANGLADTAALGPEQKRIYECALVDEALRTGNISGLTAGIVSRVQSHFRAMKLPKHAAILGRLLNSGKLSNDPYTIQAAHHSYIELPPPSPRMQIARFILDNPALFAARNTELQ